VGEFRAEYVAADSGVVFRLKGRCGDARSSVPLCETLPESLANGPREIAEDLARFKGAEKGEISPSPLVGNCQRKGQILIVKDLSKGVLPICPKTGGGGGRR